MYGTGEPQYVNRMGFRFRRSCSVLPGIRFNLSKRGVSTSVGVRGAHVTYGSSGTRETVGIPGTGLSYTQQSAPGGGHRSGHTLLWLVLACFFLWLIFGR